MTDTTTAREVRTGLFIGGEARDTADRLEIVDPARPGEIVGTAAAASEADVADAVAAAKAAFPAWSGAVRAAAGRARWPRRSPGIAEDRDEDAAVLSPENGKVRFESWVDALVFELRWNLALQLADEVETGSTLPPAPGIPVRTEVSTSRSAS